MWLEEARQLADDLERHSCLRVELIASAVGLLRELHAPIPAFTLPGRAWLLLVRHQGERTPALYGWTGDEPLFDAVWSAMAQHNLNGLSAAQCDSETLDGDEATSEWRCPVHDAVGDVASDASGGVSTPLHISEVA